MADEPQRSRLGRGLAALIGDVGDETAVVERSRGQRRAPIAHLKPSAANPRRRFAETDLDDLAASIREKGVIQPIIVRRLAGEAERFEIIAGERRWRAAQKAGVHDAPILVLDVTEREALEIAIIENVQRADLNAIEEAVGYEQLMAQFAYRQEDLARVIGKSRSHIANTMRLTKLPDDVKELVTEGALSAGHARALLALPDPSAAARKAVAKGLSVREVEAMARAPEIKSVEGLRKPKPEKDADTAALEQALSEALGLAVAISPKGEGGELSIRYRSLDQLDMVCRRLKG
ncbi:chromosome partitioning protein ParB [Methylopila jiangsuensis]|uniref:Chromosome partitioning protein ParB n=1 Tax=Methylopila jiangsuensis TaxID=586230 RepID=A0A9W6JKH1_9HYPH|nr:ParB/RepB/Spo0J family partition protein [Methylopila jiangsuensis]MDR6285221.1 ParB family chromosome partitioning protein [Methylopila jiangsuensis]GLK77389.1 chromosome partitioning protein ParB [Methylopila jiangsuensis]